MRIYHNVNGTSHSWQTRDVVGSTDKWVVRRRNLRQFRTYSYDTGEQIVFLVPYCLLCFSSLFAVKFHSVQNTPPFAVVIILVKAKYEEAQGMSLHKAISKEFRGDLKIALQVRQSIAVRLQVPGWRASRGFKLMNQATGSEGHRLNVYVCILCVRVCLLQASATSATARDAFICVVSMFENHQRS